MLIIDGVFMFKTKCAFLFLVISLIFVINISGQTSPPPEPVEKVSTEEIKINILAFTNDGSFASDISPEDLIINEDGRLHQATSVRRIPANILLILDVSSEIPYAKRNKVTAQTARSLVNALQSNDSIAVMQYAEDVKILSSWTKDKNQLTKILGDTKLGFGQLSVFNESINKAIEFFAKTPLENRHLVLITDGTDSFSEGEARDVVAKKLLSIGVNVHIISYTRLQQRAISGKKSIEDKDKPFTKSLPSGVGSPSQGRTATYPIFTINLDFAMNRKRKEEMNRIQKSEQFLTTFAEDGNGEIFLPNTISEMIEKTTILAKNIDSQYVVTYTPELPLAEAKNGETRIVEATSRKAGVEIQGRRKLVVASNK